MNSYEQLKNQFLVELNGTMSMSGDDLNLVTAALDRAAHPYEITLKQTALSTKVDPVPQLLKTYIVVKKNRRFV